ncbi:hypothetical protein BT67DRAFT_56595 [Trichocladium antarcticum]|uniref:Uncharacterized protein n=1 Tax=Trichocladium antarcticum TaxID=1450529 RepID=A0AAN6UHI6_9PEZI|nr:hypothetical protein BT67DRAFT_56595 [Trichocladium antarcticum]
MDRNDCQVFGWLCSCHASADVRRMTCSSCSWGTNLLTGVMTPKRRRKADDARSLAAAGATCQPSPPKPPSAISSPFHQPPARFPAFPPSRRLLCSAPQQRGKPAPVFQSRRGNLISSNSHLHLLTASRIFDSQGNIDRSTSRIPCANTHSSACKPVAIHELPENARVWHVCISTDVQQFMAQHMYHDFGRIGANGASVYACTSSALDLSGGTLKTRLWRLCPIESCPVINRRRKPGLSYFLLSPFVAFHGTHGARMLFLACSFFLNAAEVSEPSNWEDGTQLQQHPPPPRRRAEGLSIRCPVYDPGLHITRSRRNGVQSVYNRPWRRVVVSSCQDAPKSLVLTITGPIMALNGAIGGPSSTAGTPTAVPSHGPQVMLKIPRSYTYMDIPA